MYPRFQGVFLHGLETTTDLDQIGSSINRSVHAEVLKRLPSEKSPYNIYTLFCTTQWYYI